MTAQGEFHRTLVAWLADERQTAAPDGLLEAVIDQIAATRRRPGWRIPDRYTWAWSASRVSSMARLAALAGVVILLIMAAVAAIVVIGAPRPAPPFGLARPGLIAFDAQEGVIVSHADGSDRRVITQGLGQAVTPTWSRDGLLLAYWTRSEKGGPWDLMVWDPDRDTHERVASGITLTGREAAFGWPSNLTWSPDGRRIAYAADVDPLHTSIFIAELGGARPVPVTRTELSGMDPAWSPDGAEIAYQSSRDRTLHAVAPDGTGDRSFDQLRETTFWPDWSPDGTHIAVMAADDSGGEIFVASRNGSVVENVSSNPADEYSPTWSPDGSRLAWARVPPDGSARAWVVTADPDGTDQVEIREPADLAPPVWSPDGTRIYSYVADDQGVFHALVVLDPSGVAPVTHIPAERNLGNGNWQRLP